MIMKPSSFVTMRRKNRTRHKHRYIVVYKPAGVLGDFPDAEGRPTVRDFIPLPGKLFPAGRLDARTEGLMLLTDDGRFAHQLTHPRYGVEREYLAEVEGRPDEKVFSQLIRGIPLQQGIARVHSVRLLEETHHHTSWLKLILKEGKKRQIRRMLAAVGHPVRRLIRIRFGPITLKGLEPGQWRFLTREEIHQIRRKSDATGEKLSAYEDFDRKESRE